VGLKKETRVTDEEKISAIVESLKMNALGDIKKASLGGSKLGAFILSSCLIEAIAGFIKGQDTTGNDYKNFVTNYLPAYDGDKLYKDLRCKLVHSYSEGGSYFFIDAKREHHMQAHGSKMIINLENFVFDVENALERFCAQLQNPLESQLRQKAVRRFDDNGIIRVFVTTIPNAGSSLSTLTQPISGSD
jgi:hypothetical protein